MTHDECDCMSFGTSETGHFVCVDCGTPFRSDAGPISAELMEMVRKAQAEHDEAYTPLSAFSRRQ